VIDNEPDPTVLGLIDRRKENPPNDQTCSLSVATEPRAFRTLRILESKPKEAENFVGKRGPSFPRTAPFTNLALPIEVNIPFIKESDPTTLRNNSVWQALDENRPNQDGAAGARTVRTFRIKSSCLVLP
jgi:hypothetical protein